MTNKEIKKIINQLKTHELDIRNVPEDLMYDKEIINAERKFGLRKEGNRGYDVIHEFFFVEEEIIWFNSSNETNSRIEQLTFQNIEDYFDYLDGDIYNRACYKFCDLNKFKQFIKKNKIDIGKLQERETFLEKTIDDDAAAPTISNDELIAFDEIEKRKKLLKVWIKKFDKCKSGKDLRNVVNMFNNSELKGIIDISFFLYTYIFKDLNDEKRFASIMEYMFTGSYSEFIDRYALCLIYGFDRVDEKYNFYIGKHMQRLKEYKSLINSGGMVFKDRCYFDSNSHYYCKSMEGYINGPAHPIVSYQQYFETFQEFIDNRQGNLKNTDLSSALNLKENFSLYETDNTTKLPMSATDKLSLDVKKYYKNKEFIVNLNWKTSDGCSVKENTFSTKYFFDFVYYLQGDLSNADLLFCDGLENINKYNEIIFNGARLKSKLCDRFGIKYKTVELDKTDTRTFPAVEKNEEETSLALVKTHDYDLFNTENSVSKLFLSKTSDLIFQRVYYISDLHLNYRLKKLGCKSLDDIIYYIQKIVDIIVENASNILLIGGDVSSDFSIFILFIRLLKNKMNECKKQFDIIFILGNHELMNCPSNNIDEIAESYRKEIESYGMYLLHNELMYRNSNDEFCKISYEKLMKLSINDLKSELQNIRLAVFGGTGFSGYNEEFNANDLVYGFTLNRKDEIAESIKFESLYNKILPAIANKNTIIFTHMPKKDWSSDIALQKNFVYVSGHTHKNEFSDDGDFRIYSDNQIGYKNTKIQLKSFLIGDEYDYFENYSDGVYEITSEQYNDFYRGRNIQISFTRKIDTLFMLKKNGYYCFICKGKNEKLNILNGGSYQQLDYKDINYYYEHMDDAILNIKGPLGKYMIIMNKISEEVIKIGGSGIIHGCIVDIDWFNHIYINPVDLKITGYYALNMIDKMVYQSVPTLLKERCPKLYAEYLKMVGNSNDSLLVPAKVKNEVGCLPKMYLNTDIYVASREVKKMQKLASNILSSWYETSNTDKKQLSNNVTKNKAIQD